MNKFDVIKGKVIGSNVLSASGRIISCWRNSMLDEAIPRPLGLAQHLGKVIEVRGRLHGDLWQAEFLREVQEEDYQMITGKVMGSNIIEGPGGPITCYRSGMVESVILPLNLSDYMGLTATVTGERYKDSLYRAQIIRSKKLDFKQLATLRELVMHTTHTQEVLIDLLEKKGAITRKELHEEIKKLKKQQIKPE